MDNLLKSEIAGIINAVQRVDAPELTDNEIKPDFVETSESKFDLTDSKDGDPIRSFEEGAAHYINGKENDTYALKIICYDDFLHKFTYDDGKGHTRVNRLKDGVKMADFLVYDKSDDYVYFIVNELSEGSSSNKIRTAKKQLSDTLNQLYKSRTIARFIDNFRNKVCFISAKDNRKIVPTGGLADGFMQIYRILPDPFQFNFGQIKTHNFTAFETSYINLNKNT